MGQKVTNSVKWAGITEIISKLIVPITNMILARIVSPEAFGVIATVTMITSFADVFTDAGFQKYIIQHKFNSKEELYKSTTVAFWTNIIVSILFWLLIVSFSDLIAELVGSPNLGHVISVSGVTLVLTSFSSIQMAIYKKNFDFKTLFLVRIVGSLMPFLVTIPLALLGMGYWALIIGIICTNFSNAIILTVKSEWKPKFYYSIVKLREMFSFSMWILIESILLWLTTWVDTFIIGSFLNAYYLGLYKNSLTMVNGFLNVIIASTTPVLLTALSTYQNNDIKFNDLFFKFQQSVSIILIPLGVGIFMYRDLATNIMFGPQWNEASLFVGLWGLVNPISILIGQYIGLIFTSKGHPKLSVLSQVLQLVFLLPILFFSIQYGFNSLVIGKSLARLIYPLINIILASIFYKLSPIIMMKNIFPAVFSSLVMAFFAYILQFFNTSLLWDLISIFLCVGIYFISLLLFPATRINIINIIKNIVTKLKKKLV